MEIIKKCKKKNQLETRTEKYNEIKIRGTQPHTGKKV